MFSILSRRSLYLRSMYETIPYCEILAAKVISDNHLGGHWAPDLDSQTWKKKLINLGGNYLNASSYHFWQWSHTVILHNVQLFRAELYTAPVLTPMTLMVVDHRLSISLSTATTNVKQQHPIQIIHHKTIQVFVMFYFLYWGSFRLGWKSFHMCISPLLHLEWLLWTRQSTRVHRLQWIVQACGQQDYSQ